MNAATVERRTDAKDAATPASSTAFVRPAPTRRFSSGAAGFAVTRDAWRALAPNARYFFQAPEWVEGIPEHVVSEHPDLEWFQATDQAGPLATLVVQRAERRVARRLRLRCLRSLMVHGALFGEGLTRPNSDPRELLHRLRRTRLGDGRPWHVLELTGLRDQSTWVPAFRHARAGEVTVEPDGGVSVLDTSGGRAAWEARLSAKFRANIRNARARLARAGGGEFRVARDATSIAKAFDEFVRIEDQSWKSGQGALASDPLERGILRRFLVEGAAHGRTSVHTLTVGGQLLGAHLGATLGDTFFGIKTAYADTAANLSPGVLMLADLIEACCDDPSLARIDFVARSPWLERWGAELSPTHRVLVFNTRTTAGLVAAVAWRLRRSLQEYRRTRTPAPDGTNKPKP